MSRVLPILFNTDMVRAILDGRKTVTRRVLKHVSKDCPFCRHMNVDYIYDKNVQNIYCARCGETFNPPIRPPYQIRDILYARETYCPNYFDFVTQYGNKHGYKADYEKAILSSDIPKPKKWISSIHMPKEAARVWLKVTDVRVEKLQEITNEQILKEGTNADAITKYIKQMPEKTEEWIKAAYYLEWQHIWNSAIKKSALNLYGWDANPWVWVIEFERCERPEEN